MSPRSSPARRGRVRTPRHLPECRQVSCRVPPPCPTAAAGFTLLELVVVIGAVALLAALMLPAVNAAREAGRRTTCANNQRQLGLAVVQYASARNEFPGYCIPQAVVKSGTAKLASRPVSWVFALLPGLERRDLWDSFGSGAPPGYPESISAAAGADATGPYAAPNRFLEVLVCPSDLRAGDDDPEGIADQSSLSYVVNCGLKDFETTKIVRGSPNIARTRSPYFAPIARDWAANGIFHYQFPYAWQSASKTYRATGEKTVKVTPKAIADGLATTLLLSENADGGNWTDCLESEVGFYWQATVDKQGKAVPMAVLTGDYLQKALLRINEKAGTSVGKSADGAGDGAFGRPSSFHPGGVVATYADAHTSFLSDQIDYLVYCLIMTPQGKYSLPAGEFGINLGKRRLFLNIPDGRRIFATSSLDPDAL